MKYRLMGAIACASAMIAAPANAEVGNVSASADTQADACAKAKNMAKLRYEGTDYRWVITGFGSCQCSAKRTSDGSIYSYSCNVDVYYKRRN